jgi:hypothetical protein
VPFKQAVHPTDRFADRVGNLLLGCAFFTGFCNVLGDAAKILVGRRDQRLGGFKMVGDGGDRHWGIPSLWLRRAIHL